MAARVISAAADVALVLDPAGVIRDLSFRDVDAWREGNAGWLGRPWVETVAPDSRRKVEELLQDAVVADSVRSREINHRTTSGPTLPVRYSALSLGEAGSVLAIGRDLRPISNLQQQLVQAQQLMEREYARLRHAETRYRMLFQIASEAVLIVDSSNTRVVEANPAASELLAEPTQSLVGGELAPWFEPQQWPELQEMLDATRVAGWAEGVTARLHKTQREVQVSASLFRQDKASLYLLRLSVLDDGVGGRSHGEPLLDVVRQLPDGFVVIDDDRRVLTANSAFLDIVQLATEQQVKKESLDQWLGRPGVDLNILMANLREHGSVRNFATVVRGHYGAEEQVEVSGVAAANGGDPCFGFVIRRLGPRASAESTVARELPRSVEQLTELVGRVSLKEIIRETTDVIERLCIEAALEVSGDNRASAAQMLGLSRQSLYSKLRRHGLGDLDSGGQGG
jgi:transcriptional regulator PpsR